MLARASTTRVAFEQEAVLFHQPIDALRIDRGQTGGSPLALEERGDPPVAVSWPLIDQATHVTGMRMQSALRSGRYGLEPLERVNRSGRQRGRFIGPRCARAESGARTGCFNCFCRAGHDPSSLERMKYNANMPARCS